MSVGERVESSGPGDLGERRQDYLPGQCTTRDSRSLLYADGANYVDEKCS
jgi:hypothetical protein